MSAILATLSADDGASVTELSERAGLGRSTAARVLAALEGTGLARRERADRSADHSAPDLWFATASGVYEHDHAEPGSALDAACETSAEEVEPDPQGESGTTSDARGEVARSDEPVIPENGAEPGNASVPKAHDEPGSEPTPEHAALPTAAESEPADDPEPAMEETKVEPEPEEEAGQGAAPQVAAGRGVESDGQNATEPAAVPDPAVAPPSETGVTVRLGKGELRALVAEYLAAHPDGEFTASQVGKALEKSSGAVANVFDVLVKTGDAEMTCEKPRRFRRLATAAH